MQELHIDQADEEGGAGQKDIRLEVSVDPVASIETFGEYSQLLASPTHLARLERGYVEAIAVDYADAAAFTLRAASIAGGTHRLHRRVRQDSFTIAELDGGVVIAAVGDGVGSFPDSHYAALWACQAVCKLLSNEIALCPDFHALRPEAFLTLVNEGLFALQKSMGSQFATTLVLCAVSCNDADHVQVWLANVGNSTAAILSQTPEGAPLWQFLFGENVDATDGIATIKTSALPDQRIKYEHKLIHIPRDTALFLLTDGVSGPLALSQSVREGLGRRWMTPPAPLDFASHVNFNRLGEHDDRTAVGIWPGR
jgi:hypothetical protein